MRIVVGRPPLFDEIRATFPMAVRPGVLFAWGDIIYNPGGVFVPPQLIEHERVHGSRQGKDIEGWWWRYLAEPKFRLDEEIPAHRAEYQHICQNGGGRHERRSALAQIAGRLSGPLYGRLISLSEAKKVLQG